MTFQRALPRLLKQACLLTGCFLLFHSSGQAVQLPTPDIQVSGVAIPFVSQAVFDRAAIAFSVDPDINNDGVIDALEELSLTTPFLNKIQPTFLVTGVDLSPLPVSLPNQIRELSLALTGNEPWRLNLLRAGREASFSNMVLDIRSMTIWGDVETVDSLGTRLTSLAVPIMSPTGTSTGQDYWAIQNEVMDGVYTPTWPDTAPFARPEQLGSGYHTLGTGLYQLPGMDNDSLLISMNGLRLTSQTWNFLRSADVQTIGDIGDMLIAVRVQAIPEPSTWALMVLGLLAVTGLARQRQANTKLSR